MLSDMLSFIKNAVSGGSLRLSARCLSQSIPANAKNYEEGATITDYLITFTQYMKINLITQVFFISPSVQVSGSGPFYCLDQEFFVSPEL
jgi:hypothetical protein